MICGIIGVVEPGGRTVASPLILIMSSCLKTLNSYISFQQSSNVISFIFLDIHMMNNLSLFMVPNFRAHYCPSTMY